MLTDVASRLADGNKVLLLAVFAYAFYFFASVFLGKAFLLVCCLVDRSSTDYLSESAINIPSTETPTQVLGPTGILLIKPDPQEQAEMCCTRLWPQIIVMVLRRTAASQQRGNNPT